jgi:hypothetical protein
VTVTHILRRVSQHGKKQLKVTELAGWGQEWIFGQLALKHVCLCIEPPLTEQYSLLSGVSQQLSLVDASRARH